MTNKLMLSVERELLSTALKADASIGATATELVKGWVAMVELRALLDKPVCAKCNDTGEADSGGVHPWGEGINIQCDCTSYDKNDCGRVELKHMAVSEGGVLRWMTGRKMQDCELYAMPDGSAIRSKLFAEPPAPVALTVWHGQMPESNGKTNWTAILHRKGDGAFPLRDIAGGITIDRSEYPDRVRYEADRMRYLIGELTEEPDILDYDDKLHSGYVNPHKPAPVAVVMPDVDELAQIIRKVDGSHNLGAGSLAEAILEEVARLNGVTP